MPILSIPEPSLVLLIGAAGSGKSTFAKRHFKSTEVLSSDFCRALVADSESDQCATEDAFEVLRFIATKRLKAGRLTVIDATNVQREARERSLELARQLRMNSIAIVLALPDYVCLRQNQCRTERCVDSEIIEEQLNELRNSLPGLPSEGFARVFVLSSVADVENAVLERRFTQPGNSELPS